MGRKSTGAGRACPSRGRTPRPTLMAIPQAARGIGQMLWGSGARGRMRRPSEAQLALERSVGTPDRAFRAVLAGAGRPSRFHWRESRHVGPCERARPVGPAPARPQDPEALIRARERGPGRELKCHGRPPTDPRGARAAHPSKSGDREAAGRRFHWNIRITGAAGRTRTDTP